MDLSDIITLERVEIVEETEDAYTANYKGITHEIAKDTKSHWVDERSSDAEDASQKLVMRLEQRLVPEAGIFQDKEAPQEFKEVMIFHELREKEYANVGFEDAHERAMNDELLYVLKFFDEKTREGYLTFAQENRKKYATKPEEKARSIHEAYSQWLSECREGVGLKEAHRIANECLGNDTRTRSELEILIARHIEFLNAVVRQNLSYHFAFIYTPAVLCAAVNRIPAAVGEIVIAAPQIYVENRKLYSSHDHKRNYYEEIKEDFAEFLNRKKTKIEVEGRIILETQSRT